MILKLPILCIALWTLFTHFDPMAVVAGGSVVMVSIVLAAALELPPHRGRRLRWLQVSLA